MIKSFFVSDLHGIIGRYENLFREISRQKPSAVFIGGDILPHGSRRSFLNEGFFKDFLYPAFLSFKNEMQENYPEVFIILGNDDPACNEKFLIDFEYSGAWKYIHQKKIDFAGYHIFGYSYVPPSPFLLKDWEKYDVSRFVDPGCVPVEEGIFSINVNKNDLLYMTIREDINNLIMNDFVAEKSVFLFHTPPYQSDLDRAALDGMMFEHVPLDVHVGSIAIQRFIHEYQPFITLHGHIHESTRLTGKWSAIFGKTTSFNAAHDGKELSLVVFDLENPAEAERFLI